MFLNLYPDMGRSQYTTNDTFIYAAAIETKVWVELQKYCRRTTERAGYLLPDDIEGLEDVIILRDPAMSDDDCLTAQAYIRLVDNCRARVYCVPNTDKLTHYDIINASAGAPRVLCKMVSLYIYNKEGMENKDV